MVNPSEKQPGLYITGILSRSTFLHASMDAEAARRPPNSRAMTWLWSPARLAREIGKELSPRCSFREALQRKQEDRQETAILCSLGRAGPSFKRLQRT